MKNNNIPSEFIFELNDQSPIDKGLELEDKLKNILNVFHKKNGVIIPSKTNPKLFKIKTYTESQIKKIISENRKGNKIESDMFHKLIEDYSGLKNYNVIDTNMKKQEIILKLKEGESWDDGAEVKDKEKLKSICKYFKMSDGYVERNSTEQGVIKIVMFSKKQLENIHKIKNPEMKKKMIIVAGHIEKFRITEINDSYILFENKENESFDSGELKNAIQGNLPQYLGMYNAKLEQHGTNGFKMILKAKMPSWNDEQMKTELINTEENYEDDCLLLGTMKLSGNNRYAKTPRQDELRGKLNGHLLIIGGTGSGKSFGFNIIMQNWINKDTYRELYKIYIINFKGSSDYNIYKDLDKVEYSSGDVTSALVILKKALVDMNTRFIINTEKNWDNFKGQKILLIIDEIQKILQEIQKSGQSKVIEQSWKEMVTVLLTLITMMRAANMSLICILQSPSAEQLPGGTSFRDQFRHRFALKNKKMDLVFSPTFIEEENISGGKLLMGQFVYLDDLENYIREGYVQMVDSPFLKLHQHEDKMKKERRKQFDNLIFKMIKSNSPDSLVSKFNKIVPTLKKETIIKLAKKIIRDRKIKSMNEEQLTKYAISNKLPLDSKDDNRSLEEFVISRMDRNTGFSDTIYKVIPQEKNIKNVLQNEFPNEDLDRFKSLTKEEIQSKYKTMGLTKDNDAEDDKELQKDMIKYEKVAYRMEELIKADMKQLEDDKKETVIDSFEDLKEMGEPKNYVEIALKEVEFEETDEGKKQADFNKKVEDINYDDLMEEILGDIDNQEGQDFDRDAAKELMKENKVKKLPKKLEVNKQVVKENQEIEHKLKTGKLNNKEQSKQLSQDIDRILGLEIKVENGEKTT